MLADAWNGEGEVNDDGREGKDDNAKMRHAGCLALFVPSGGWLSPRAEHATPSSSSSSQKIPPAQHPPRPTLSLQTGRAERAVCIDLTHDIRQEEMWKFRRMDVENVECCVCVFSRTKRAWMFERKAIIDLSSSLSSSNFPTYPPCPDSSLAWTNKESVPTVVKLILAVQKPPCTLSLLVSTKVTAGEVPAIQYYTICSSFMR